MIYRTFKPKQALAHLVRYYWILEGRGPYTHFSLPEACAELIFHFRGSFRELAENGESAPSFTAGLHAPGLQVRKFHTGEDFEILGAYLYPQAVPLLFSISADELTGQMTEIDLLAGSQGRSTEDAIANAADHAARVQLLEGFIEARALESARATLPVFRSIQLIIGQRGLVKIADLPSTACLSTRQFKRQFLRYTGFTPKLFSRIVRFQSAMEFYGTSNVSLSEIAYRCGYYDQAHFTNDFRELSGIHPGRFFSGKSPATAWRD